MYVLEFTFKLLTICGCWRPYSWTSLHKRVVYDVYTCIIIFLLCSFMLSQCMDIVLIVDNPNDFSDNFFVLLAMIISCCKLFSLLINRKNIKMLTNTLMEQPCRPLGQNEILIQSKYDKNIEIKTLQYIYLGTVTQLFMILISLLTNFRKRKLTYRAWLPFDYSSMMLFCLAYTHQQITLIAGAILNIAYDSLICGLLVHICCQIELLEYRLNRIVSYSNDLHNSVQQHCHIFRLAYIVNTKFRFTITIQFMISMLIICFSLYQLTKSTSGAKYVEMTLYMICMLTQIFIYCWYGNKVKLKSCQLVDNIFEMEWVELDTDVKKSLMIIMKRAAVPIQITSAYVISMNLESFMGLLKTSYSIYNILQQTRE